MSSTPKRGEAQLFRSHVTALLSISFSHICPGLAPRLLALFRHTPLDVGQSQDRRLCTLTCTANASAGSFRSALLTWEVLSKMLQMRFEYASLLWLFGFEMSVYTIDIRQ